jgi:hypothetical protein
VDRSALNLHGARGFVPQEHLGQHQKIFQDFLNSGDPLVLDGERYAPAPSAFLKILFGLYGPAGSKFKWSRFTRQSRILRVGMRPFPQQHHANLPLGTNWGRIESYWYLRLYFSSLELQSILEAPQHRYIHLDQLRVDEICILSSHLQFLLEKSAHSGSILRFARRKVFRFGYLHQNHPIYVKKPIFLSRDTFDANHMGGGRSQDLRVGLGA